MRLKTLLVLSVLIFPGFVLADEKTKSLQENFYLQQEYELIKSPSFYFIVDLHGKRIDLKARGIVLREWKVQEVRVWGRPASRSPVKLLKKSSLVAPQRRKIIPGSAGETPEKASLKPPAKNAVKESGKKAEEPFELEALELRHMPKTFTLWMEGGIGIHIRAKEKAFSSSIRGAWNSVKWLVVYPLRTLFSYKKRPFTSIDISLDSVNEVQALYWTLLEGYKGIIKVVSLP